MSKVTITPDAGAINSLLEEILQLDDSEFSQPFAERLQLLLDAGNAFVPGSPINRTDETTGASEIVIPLEPTDTLLCLFAAFRAGDGNFEVFDHALSLAENSNNTLTSGACELS